MSKLVEATHVTLGGEVGTNDWALPYLDQQHSQYNMELLTKHVASTTPRALTWNATVIDGDVASFVDDLKRNAGQNLLKYGNGPLDATLMEHLAMARGLIDEFHLYLTPVAIGKGHAPLREHRHRTPPPPRRRHTIRQRRADPRLRAQVARLSPLAPATGVHGLWCAYLPRLHATSGFITAQIAASNTAAASTLSMRPLVLTANPFKR